QPHDRGGRKPDEVDGAEQPPEGKQREQCGERPRRQERGRGTNQIGDRAVAIRRYREPARAGTVLSRQRLDRRERVLHTAWSGVRLQLGAVFALATERASRDAIA